jgi:hypothetical protein
MVDPLTRAAALTLLNLGGKPVEISLDTFYGYPVTDTAGILSLYKANLVDDTMPNATPWIRIFPDHLRLEPHARRTVRLMVEPPAHTPKKEYWARLAVTARDGTMQRMTPDTTRPGVHIGLAVQVRSVIPMFYRHGTVNTGVRLETPHVTVTDDSLIIRTPLTRTGTAAYQGTITGTLHDSQGHTIATRSLPVRVYYTITPRLVLPIHAAAPGQYTLTLTINTTTLTLPAAAVLPAPSVQQTVPVRIP